MAIDKSPLQYPERLTQAGVLPLTKGPVRFAVGSPDGISSNAWRVWTSKVGDIYIACRDNFRETKVSLHASGRWRMGFTSEAVNNNPALLEHEQNRAWEVWDKPLEQIPAVVIAFRLIFLTAELAVTSELRPAAKWKNVVFIEEAPPGKITMLTLFVTCGNVPLIHESERSFTLACLELGNDLFAQILAHGEDEGEWQKIIRDNSSTVLLNAQRKGIQIPSDAYTYFYGQLPDSSRFLVGARLPLV